jgi:thiol-disulfide isomerase/thioredoxin
MQTKNKFLIVLFLISISFSYTFYTKYKIDNYFSKNETLVQTSILKDLPSIDLYDLKGTQVNLNSFKNANSGFYVHIWGTWCGPCETEFGVLLNFSERLRNQNVKFLLIAVNDEEVKIMKFLKRYKSIPENAIILIDKNNQVMDKFGTFKVPETFLFSSQGQVLNKYVGPQEWMQDIYTTQVYQYLNLK